VASILLSYYDREGGIRTFETAASEVVVGSGESCHLRIDSLLPEECRIYLSVDGYYAADIGGELTINSRPGPGFLQDGDEIVLGSRLALRFGVEKTPTRSAPAPSSPQEGSSSKGVARGVQTGRKHSPGLALAVALFIPGAGQAYNGQPIKGLLLAVLSVLILPWILSLWDARRTALRVVDHGGRTGRGGLLWVLLHCWGLVNLGLLVLVVLSLAGVLA
jgi:TM2 domain-containing membrane protein YozV